MKRANEPGTIEMLNDGGAHGRSSPRKSGSIRSAAPAETGSLRFRGHRPFGAQGKQECLCYERRLADLVRDGIGYGLGVRSHLRLQTVGLNAGTQCRDQGRDSRQTRRSAFAALP